MIEGSGSLKTFAGFGVARNREIDFAETLPLGEHGAMGENKNGESQRNTRNRFHNFSFLLVLMSLKVCQAAQFLSSGPVSLVVTFLQLRATPKQNAVLHVPDCAMAMP
jgi:hypothetical protein